MSTCVLMGPDYQVYVCVAVLKHMQPDILLHTQAQDLQVYLKVSQRPHRPPHLTYPCCTSTQGVCQYGAVQGLGGVLCMGGSYLSGQTHR